MIDFELPISKGLMGYKSRLHLSRGPEGAVRQAAQREATLAKKKKKTEKVRRRFDKEKVINQQVRGGESRSDVEAKLESEEPTELGSDASTSKDEGDRGVVVTSVEHREPAAASASGGQDAKRRGDVPALRKRATSLDATVE